MSENLIAVICTVVFLTGSIGTIIYTEIKKLESKTNKINQMSTDQQVEYRNGIHKIEYEGHSYIIMSGSKYQNGICHDENCKCKNK